MATAQTAKWFIFVFVFGRYLAIVQSVAGGSAAGQAPPIPRPCLHLRPIHAAPLPSDRDAMRERMLRNLSSCIHAVFHNLSAVLVNKISRQITETFDEDMVDEMITHCTDSFGGGRLRAAVTRCVVLSGFVVLDLDILSILLILRCFGLRFVICLQKPPFR